MLMSALSGRGEHTMDRNREDCNAELIPHRKARRESYLKNR